MSPSQGTLMRTLYELTDGAIAQLYVDVGMPEYRPRYSPVVRALVAGGPMTIRDLAEAVGVTHSAASQTVSQMRRAGLVTLETGPSDGRQRIVHLTDKTLRAMPVIEAEWQATVRAADELDAELPVPLAEVLLAAVRALESRPFRDRIRAAGFAVE
ncbi:MarR family winged helix-turn-helix transcriptional regulator [Nonomuraea soli]|uniref:DNA-binding MarR family transcriptional regulator n=1 Tax=Nonomuraea soli TaxID=1032476 RepID=A0A7W0HW05_9ACTN|nr:MarR family winged helix-turn-helix transcriptional regulator [Nonomuraea soli]MBA2897341.1 DNA-binding MarR family transcriptional regulator [Nonomuraea soli]